MSGLLSPLVIALDKPLTSKTRPYTRQPQSQTVGQGNDKGDHLDIQTGVAMQLRIHKYDRQTDGPVD